MGQGTWLEMQWHRKQNQNEKWTKQECDKVLLQLGEGEIAGENHAVVALRRLWRRRHVAGQQGR